MSDDPYVYPGTSILKNRPGIRDAERLESYERNKAIERAAQGVPTGDFDLQHLQAIHRHLFQDVYDWAGEIRTVEIAKGGQQFIFRQYIRSGMEDVHRRIRDSRYLKGTSADQFARDAGAIIGDVNHVHPFREGNGRTQLFYLKQLAERAGHPLALARLDGPQWIEASIQANRGEYAGMTEAIRGALIERHRVGRSGTTEDRLQRLRERATKSRDKDSGDRER